MADLKINGATPSAFYFGSTAATAVYYGSTKLWEAGSPQPVLPAHTIRCKFTSGYTPSIGLSDSQTLVDADENIWDIYRSSNDWYSLFYNISDLVNVIAANTTGITKMGYMFSKCSSLTSVPLIDTSSVTDMSGMFANCSGLTLVPSLDTSSATTMNYMFYNCYAVESGALALYQQSSSQANPPTDHTDTFTNCGRDTVTGAAELAQIPASWGGTGA